MIDNCPSDLQGKPELGYTGGMDTPELDSLSPTPQMIEAGLSAWREAAGDEYIEHSITNDLVVSEIFMAMVLEKRFAPPSTYV